eukprot:scaffold2188_cov388-Prasinococcus_capsulatus_cf.AAC.15
MSVAAPHVQALARPHYLMPWPDAHWSPVRLGGTMWPPGSTSSTEQGPPGLWPPGRDGDGTPPTASLQPVAASCDRIGCVHYGQRFLQGRSDWLRRGWWLPDDAWRWWLGSLGRIHSGSALDQLPEQSERALPRVPRCHSLLLNESAGNCRRCLQTRARLDEASSTSQILHAAAGVDADVDETAREQRPGRSRSRGARKARRGRGARRR